MTAIDLKTLQRDVYDTHQAIVAALAALRSDRDELNARIKELVADEKEAARALRALAPTRRKS